jgi:HD-GYP domain-containing protein (c-di-GMP phosphodiesterase class II)
MIMSQSRVDQWLDSSEILKGATREVQDEARRFAEGQLSRIQELVKIGMALSAEKRLEYLLEMIVSEARRFTNADGGTLYIKNNQEQLEFKIIQNDSLKVRVGGTGENIVWSPVPLKDAKGRDNHRNVSAYCALVGKAVNIADVYHADFDFGGTREFDANTGYRSKSMLLIPMRGHDNDVIGVLQLLNAMDPETGQVIGFDDYEIDDITSLASQAAIAITNVRLVRELELLLDAFLRVIAAAIDEKSPYTGGHVVNVAGLTLSIAEMVNKDKKGAFADVELSAEELDELKMAAWLHDIGKITTPEYVVDKSTKLETIFDRIELVRTRVEILKRDAEIATLKARLGEQEEEAVSEELPEEIRQFDGVLSFLEEVNVGGEFLSDEKIWDIRRMADRHYLANGKKSPLLNDDEVMNLSIRKGTLNDKERAIINNHVSITKRMLASLPFPRKYEKVPEIAAMHHEKLDCTGYPNGLCARDIPLQSRILAVADVFEALTAADRPYKQGKKLSESVRILSLMVKDNHLDEDVCDLLVRSGLVQDYACEKISKRQRDQFEWKGETFEVCEGKRPVI